MAGLIRQGHFLGAKLRSLRKRNGLTLDELSARCVQIDAASAPSVSYLSMVETGKRMPSAATLDMLAGIFSKDARWFLDENTEVEAAPPQREPRRTRSHAAGARISVLARAAAKRVARALVANRHDGAPIRAAADPRLAGDPPQQFSRYRARGGGGRQAADAAHARCGRWICASGTAWRFAGSTATAASRAAPWCARASRRPAPCSSTSACATRKSGSSTSSRSSSVTRFCTTAMA